MNLKGQEEPPKFEIPSWMITFFLSSGNFERLTYEPWKRGHLREE
jgi:hypothetical protein